MTLNGWLQIILFFAVICFAAKPMGLYMLRVFERRRTWLDPVLRPIEKLLYRLTGVREEEEMRWTEYAIAMLLFSGVTMVLTYVIERIQNYLPLNPQHLAAVTPALAWNTAISFTTNTNWQAYTPETTMSYLTQMAGLATHNFWSAAVGMALAIAFIRGIARHEQKTLGNFWVDMTRAILWICSPSALSMAVLVSQGVVQNTRAYDTATLVEPQNTATTGADGKVTTNTITTQTVAQGPTASQEAIKMLGTNGGGFFNANSAHPFENPTPVSNFLEMISIFLIPAGLTVVLGQMVKSPKHGWAVFAAMALYFSSAFQRSTGRRPKGTRCFTGSISVPRSPSPAAIWKARKCASALLIPRSSPPSPRTQAVVRSTVCMTVSRRSAASFLCRIFCWARLSSAEPARVFTECSSSWCSPSLSPG